MDPSRYGLQQGWDNNSALEGYGAAVHEPNYRIGGSYDDTRFADEKYPRGNSYPRNAYHREILDRENYSNAPHSGPWPESRRRSYEEYPVERGPRRHEKMYADSYHDLDAFPERDMNSYHDLERFRDGYTYRDHGYDRPPRFRGREHDDYAYDDYDYRSRFPHQNRDGSHEREYEYSRRSYDSDYDRGTRRDGSYRRHESSDRDRERKTLSRERDPSPHRRHQRSRSRSRSRGWDNHSRSRSPCSRSHSRSHREDSYDRFERRRDREEKRYRDQYSVAPSATVVVKGLSQKITEEDLYQILAEWGPLRHVRVIKERNSGISRGFAFIDFPSVDAAHAMMDKIGEEGLVVDGRQLLFEYSSKPTGGPLGPENTVKSGHSSYRNITVPCDWMCTICGCINFARRTACFQCNEPRTDDSPPADMASSNAATFGKKSSEAGPTHVLVVRGLDENADEDMLRYEFSKHAPIKDLRLVRDKFTHVSRGFAFLHFYSVDDATKALEAANGTTLERNGQILRVAYAKSIMGPGSGGTGSSQSSSLAAAAIEAAAFSQQYDAYGWAPKEYNPDEKQSTTGMGQSAGDVAIETNSSAPQSGFVWDEASGYYYDASSGFYYDGNTGLYYDGNNGIWYSYDQQTQQYVPCTDQSGSKPSDISGPSKKSECSTSKKAVISAPAATVASADKNASLPDAVQAAATAAMAAEKKGKSKEIKLASKSSILANKKKMSNVLSKWKQRSHEGQTTRVALDGSEQSALTNDRVASVGQPLKNKSKVDMTTPRDAVTSDFGVAADAATLDSQVKPIPVGNSQGGTIKGVIRGSIKADTSYSAASVGFSNSTSACTGAALSSASADVSTVVTPFKTDSSALGCYTPASSAGGGKRRFSEAPKEQSQNMYRDRAAERRSLYGSSSTVGGDISDFELDRDATFRKNYLDPMPFPPGVGGRGPGVGPADATSNVQSYEVITAEKAIDESNVGNRMLRNMGWQEGLGLGKDGSGMVEPVQALAMDNRAGLGSQQKKLDPTLEVQAGDSYKTVIQKKALARFREMS